MSKGVYTFRGGTDLLIKKMAAELERNGVEVRKHVAVERVLVDATTGIRQVTGVVATDAPSAAGPSFRTPTSRAPFSSWWRGALYP